MRCVLQVVKEASVSIEGEIKSQIKRGYLLFLGYEKNDDFQIIKKMIDKIVSLRLFKDALGKTNLGLKDIDGEILAVSQFTLYADVKKGRRPSFTNALSGSFSKDLYDETISYLSSIIPCKQGVFGADMEISLINDGPFTLMIDSGDL